MATEEESVFQLNNVALSSWIYHGHCLEDANLDLGLAVELGLVADHLQCHQFAFAVVERFEHLSERPLAQQRQHLIPICDGVSRGNACLTTATGKVPQ